MKRQLEKTAHVQTVIVCFLISLFILCLGLFINYQLGNAKTYQKLLTKYQDTIKKKAPIIRRWNTYSNAEIPLKLRIPPEFSVNVVKVKGSETPVKIQFSPSNKAAKDSTIESIIVEPRKTSTYELYTPLHCVTIETVKIATMNAEISTCIRRKKEEPTFITKLTDKNHVIFVALYTKSDFTDEDVFEYRYLLNSIQL